MAMGKRSQQSQEALFVVTADLPSVAGHPFYEKLNTALRAMAFDQRIEAMCEPFYDELGRRGIPPGVYFRMTWIGYFEGIDSERGIAWRVGDSLSLRRFLGYTLTDATPDHSSLSRIRQRLSGEVHAAAFEMVLAALVQAKVVKGKTIGVDATTLEANAAMRSIVRRDTGQSYDDYLDELARQSGVDEPTREDRAKVDKDRKNKGKNADWEHPHDPDARITKMKDGRTHLAHKAEHVVDLASGALLGVSLHEANKGDAQTGQASVAQAADHLARAVEQAREATGETANDTTDDAAPSFKEVVADKGYHSNDSLLGFEAMGLRPQISEPNRGRRRWKGKADAKKAVYANRRRLRRPRGKRLQRERGEKLERPNAHLYETGGMRRTHLRGHDNILKRLIVHAGGFNLSLLMRALFGLGTPRQWRAASKAVRAAFLRLLAALIGAWRGSNARRRPLTPMPALIPAAHIAL